jgi:beta-lactamase superfamily II metal-dependent hydrolase
MLRRIALSVSIILTVGLCVLPATAADVTIHCLAVGQADATLIVSPSGQTLLFDGGDNGDGDDIVIPYLQSLGISTLTYMAASHYHSDHIGGLDEVYDVIGVSGAVYDRGWSYYTGAYDDYAAAVAPHRTTIYDGQVIDMGGGVTVTCLGLNGNGTESAPFTNTGEENEYGVVLLVEYGDFDFLVAGDLTGGYGSYGDVETSIGPEAGDIEVYHVNHHGSYSSSNTSMLNDITPQVSIISVPDDSPYGHPHQDTLDRLNAVGSYIYQTAQGSSSTYPSNMRTVVNGHVVINSDGNGEFYVDGDLWEMDEPGTSAVPSADAFTLLGNVPNPFNPATEILFATRRGGPVSLSIYDLGGRRLLQKSGSFAPGRQSFRWNGLDDGGRNVPSGIYLYTVTSRDGADSGRMMLTK